MTATYRHDLDGRWACPWCIDGFTPMGIHPDLGPVYRMCPTEPWCIRCGDTGLFPADILPFDRRDAALLAAGRTAIWCPHCLGITSVAPLTKEGGLR